MARGGHTKFHLHWALILLIQLFAMLGLAVLTALALYLGKTVHSLLIWGLFPLAGFCAAEIATTGGLNNYAAWIAPPAALWLGHYLCWSFSPDFGPVLLTAFLSLVGAATGEVVKRGRKQV